MTTPLLSGTLSVRLFKNGSYFFFTFYIDKMSKLPPSVWGPSMWDKIHTVTDRYPEHPTPSDKDAIVRYFNTLTIPCETCQQNYSKKLLQKPIEFCIDSRKDLQQWAVDIHNIVNLDTGKDYVPFDKVIRQRRSVYRRSVERTMKNALMTLVVLILLYYLIYKK